MKDIEMKKGMLKRLIAIVLTMALIAVLPLTESGVTIFADTVAAPTITQQPVSLYAEPGTTAKFTITATDTAPLTYQWQSRKNESSNWANSAQSGAKTKTLSVATTAGLHGWQFRCIVKDGNGNTTASDAATLYTKTVIVTQPKNLTVKVGDAAEFTVVAFGKDPLTYQWQSRKDANSNWSNSGLTGAKTPTLSVVTSVGLHGWQFRCVVKDSAGKSAVSNAVTLTLKPSILTQPVDMSTTAGSTAKFTVKAFGKGPLSYQWQSRKNANSSWSNSGQSGAKTATLSVATTAGLNGWQFRCIVKDTNGQSTASNAATLTIVPKITKQPQDANTVKIGSQVQFTVAATGKAPLSYQWQRKDAGASNWVNIKNATGTTLTVNNLKLENHADQYRCVVIDGNGKKNGSKAALLNLFLGGQDIPINETIFPDAKFRAIVSGLLDPNGKGKAEYYDFIEIKELEIQDEDITSLKGLEFFTELHLLDCSGNELKSLNLAGNSFLQSLFCSHCELTTIDVSRNPELQNLICGGNRLTTIDVKNNPKMTWFNCADNQLTTLDLSANTKLDDFICDENKLVTLDLKANKLLTGLCCSKNQLVTLDLSANTKLETLLCNENRLTSLDLSNNVALQDFYCHKNALTKLVLTNKPYLESVMCYENQLTSLIVNNVPRLRWLLFDQNRLTSVDLSDIEYLYAISCQNNPFTELDVSKNYYLDEIYCDEEDVIIGALPSVKIRRR